MTPEPQDQPISPYLNAARQEFKRPKVDRQKLWGVPSKPEDVYQTFVNFLDGQCSTLPWCEQVPAPETSAIASSLKLLNANGFLTINSQPAVNGRPSTDPEVGWGGPGGYVFQKVRASPVD